MIMFKTNTLYTVYPNTPSVSHEVADRLASEEVGGCLGTGPSYDNSRRCKKNPGHGNFIPAREFQRLYVATYFKGDLPGGITDQNLVDLVHCFSPLTVRIKGNHISRHRPSQWGGVDGAYPFSRYRGQAASNVGSGWLEWIDEVNPCCWCIPQRRCWRISLLTAKHVIFDNSEATLCDMTLFDDGVSTPVTLTGANYLEGDTDRDYSRLMLKTYEEDLAEKLKCRHCRSFLPYLHTSWEG